MIDSLLGNLERAAHTTVRADLGLSNREYAVLTLHRPSNVDEAAPLAEIIQALEQISSRLPVIFPVHPRTRKMIAELGFGSRLGKTNGLKLIDPVGYLDFLALLRDARLVLTDSGGIQEETTVLGVPCVTLRENTERPITIELGTNTLAGHDSAKIVAAAYRALDDQTTRTPRDIPRWDGRTADRILDALWQASEGVRSGEGQVR
jgi:UDP-N-acetylglucosamine 2-epimerase (non-hydrolysing)